MNDAAVIVPTYLHDSQHQAIKVRSISEPAATEVAYGSDKRGYDEQNELIYDMGGDTFDDSTLSNKDDIFEVKLLHSSLSMMTGFERHQREESESHVCVAKPSSS